MMRNTTLFAMAALIIQELFSMRTPATMNTVPLELTMILIIATTVRTTVSLVMTVATARFVLRDTT